MDTCALCQFPGVHLRAGNEKLASPLFLGGGGRGRGGGGRVGRRLGGHSRPSWRVSFVADGKARSRRCRPRGARRERAGSERRALGQVRTARMARPQNGRNGEPCGTGGFSSGESPCYPPVLLAHVGPRRRALREPPGRGESLRALGPCRGSAWQGLVLLPLAALRQPRAQCGLVACFAQLFGASWTGDILEG